MGYLNRWITSEDRERFQLGRSDKWLFFAAPSRSWVIDEAREIFLRTLCSAARHSGLDNPESYREEDFHFHWMGRDFLVCTRHADLKEIEEFTGRLIEEPYLDRVGKRVYPFLIRSIAEESQEGSFKAVDREQFFVDLREAFAEGCGGAFALASSPAQTEPRTAILKVSPAAEVSL